MVRNYNSPYNVRNSFYILNISNGVPVTALSGGDQNIAMDVKSGSDNVHYKYQIAKGLNATTNYTRKGVVRAIPLRYSMASRTSSLYDLRRTTILHRSHLPSFYYNPNDVVLDASIRLKRKLRETTGSSNQLINLVELRELPRTLGTLARSASGLINAVTNRKERGKALRRYASEQWLNWSFGISPTLGAVDDMISSINDYLSRDDRNVKEYGVFSKVWNSSTTTDLPGSNHFVVKLNGAFRHELSCKITAGHRMNLRSANNYSMPKHLGFDISSVVPTVWELIPYSWLVDYFTTAGDFIEDTFAADFGLTSVYISQSIKLRITGKITGVPVRTKSGAKLEYFESKPGEFDYFEFTRTSLPALPRAPLRFRTANEVASHAVNKLLNLSSILGSRKL